MGLVLAGRHSVIVALGVISVLSVACSRAPAKTEAADPATSAATTSTTRTAAGPVGPADEVRTIPVSVQGVAPIGVTVRVKSVELGLDATILDVSVSYSSTMASYVDMATTESFLQTETGDRLMLKRPEDNRDLRIQDGATMDGKLVFLGRVPPGSGQVRLVFNQGNTGDNSVGPGMDILIPLKPA